MSRSRRPRTVDGEKMSPKMLILVFSLQLFAHCVLTNDNDNLRKSFKKTIFQISIVYYSWNR